MFRDFFGNLGIFRSNIGDFLLCICENTAWTEQACLENLLSLGHLPYLSGVAKGGRYRGHAPLNFTKTKKNDVKTSTHFAYIKHSHEPLQIFFGDATTTCIFPESARILLGAFPN